jgi:hypothetical protein
MKRLLGSVADLRDDGAGNDECHHAIGMKMPWGTCPRWIGHFDQADIARRLSGELLSDHVASRRGDCGLLRGNGSLSAVPAPAANKETRDA